MKEELPENLTEKVYEALKENDIYTDIQTIKNMKKYDFCFYF